MHARFRPVVDAIAVAASDHVPKLLGIVLFGSVARGTAGPSADIDLLVVADAWPPGAGSARFGPLDAIEADPRVAGPLGTLRASLFRAELGWIPWWPDQLERFSFLHLDLAVDGVVLLDSRGVLHERLHRVRSGMARLGTRKEPTRGGTMWVLKPGLRSNEAVALP